MRLDECKIGTVVILVSGALKVYKEIGHIVGFTYNTEILQDLDSKVYYQALRNSTIPIVKFPDKEKRGVHPNNLEIYNHDMEYMKCI